MKATAFVDELQLYAFYDAVPLAQAHRWALLAVPAVFYIVLPLGRYLLTHDNSSKGLRLVPGLRGMVPYLGRVYDSHANARWQSMKK